MNTRSKKSASHSTIFHTVVFDRSGSMASLQGSHIQQLRNYLIEQKKAAESGNKIKITVIIFDDVKATWIDNIDVLDMKIPTEEEVYLRASPRGMTRMIDTVIEAVTKQKHDIEKYRESLPLMVRELDPSIQRWLYIISDGYDNKSKHTSNEMKEIMEAERETGLGTIFLAANQGDAQDLADHLGLNRDTALTFGADRTTSSLAMGYANDMARQISSEGHPPPRGFSAMQRSSSLPDPEPLSGELLPPPSPLSLYRHIIFR